MHNFSTLEQTGWFDKIKNSIRWNDLVKKFNASKYILLDMAFFLGIGFLVGFLWKRYANYCIAFLVFLVFLVVLQQLNIIEMQINWTKMQQCCGIEPLIKYSDMPTMIWEWVKNNILIVFSFAIGFCLGAKLS